MLGKEPIGFTSEESADRRNYQVLGTSEFYLELFTEIQRAQNRVWIQTMAFENSHFSTLLINHLIKAVKNNVNVKFVYDAYSDFVTDNTFNHFPLLTKANEQFRKFTLEQTHLLLKQLQKGDIETHKTNIPKWPGQFTPLPGAMGRDHKKIVIIDNTAYIGGINFTELDAKRIDFMTKIKNPVVVSNLALIFNQSLYDQAQTDREIRCDQVNTLLIDEGKSMKSLVMQHAYNLIEHEHDQIIVVSPFPPSGRFAKKLNQAVSKGVEVLLITSSKESLPGFASKASQFVHNIGTGTPLYRTMYANGIVHAKALIAVGNKETIIGSHNFDELFVKFNTEEIALRTKEISVITELKNFLKKIEYLD